jgi:hypothetical protein
MAPTAESVMIGGMSTCAARLVRVGRMVMAIMAVGWSRIILLGSVPSLRRNRR